MVESIQEKPQQQSKEELHTQIQDTVLKFYSSSPLFSKYSKDASTWTVLAAFVAELPEKIEIISLATGTKSIGKSKMCKEGLILNDLHAEVLARRSLLLSLYKEMQWMAEESQENSCLMLKRNESGKFSLQNEVKLHLYVTEPPCGDASML